MVTTESLCCKKSPSQNHSQFITIRHRHGVIKMQVGAPRRSVYRSQVMLTTPVAPHQPCKKSQKNSKKITKNPKKIPSHADHPSANLAKNRSQRNYKFPVRETTHKSSTWCGQNANTPLAKEDLEQIHIPSHCSTLLLIWCKISKTNFATIILAKICKNKLKTFKSLYKSGHIESAAVS